MYVSLVKIISTQQVIKQKLLNYHWNVTGPDFYNAHMLLQRLYEGVDSYTDRLAEHSRAFGRAPGLYSVYLKFSVVQENLNIPQEVTAIYKEVQEDLLKLIAEVKLAAKEAGDLTLPGTENLLGDFAEYLDKALYLISSNQMGYNV